MVRFRLGLMVLGVSVFMASLYLVINHRSADAPRSSTLSITGPGYKKSRVVQVHAGWELQWAYDCPPSIGQGGFGIVGSFDVVVRIPSGDEVFPQQAISTQGSAGHGSVTYPQGGSYYLEIESECNWEAEILDAGGRARPAASPAPST